MMFREKRKLKGTGKSITESLTTKEIGQLTDVKDILRFQGKIFLLF